SHIFAAKLAFVRLLGDFGCAKSVEVRRRHPSASDQVTRYRWVRQDADQARSDVISVIILSTRWVFIRSPAKSGWPTANLRNGRVVPMPSIEKRASAS